MDLGGIVDMPQGPSPQVVTSIENDKLNDPLPVSNDTSTNLLTLQPVTPEKSQEKKRDAPDFEGASPESKKGNKRMKRGPKEWTSNDNLLLKDAVINPFDFVKIAKNIRFSCRFTPQELEDRWRQVLYDPEISDQVAKGIQELPSTTKRVLWTPKEEEILTREASKPDFAGFQTLLEDFRNKFHPSRTARSLEAHYYKMKRGKQATEATPTATVGNVIPTPLSVTTFNPVASTPSMMSVPGQTDLLGPKEVFVPVQEVAIDWTQNPNAKAVIRGTKLLYYIEKNETLIGRGTKDNIVDINLAIEGDASKISRKQAIISFSEQTQWTFKNIGKPNAMVNSVVVESNQTVSMSDQCIIEFYDFKLHFHLNPNRNLSDVTL